MMAEWMLLLLVGVVAGGLSGIIGTGASIIVLPFLVPIFGAQHAVPIMAVAGLLGNFARVLAWWRAVDLRAAGVYALAGIPAAIAGAYVLLAIPAGWADAALGIFILVLLPVRRLLDAYQRKLTLAHLAIWGVGVGFLTGMFLSTGPLSVPAFLGYGLVRGAFIATEAAASMAVQLAKIIAFNQFGALSLQNMGYGLIVGAALFAGTFASKPFVLRLSDRHFRLMMEVVTVISAGSLIVAGFYRAAEG